MVVPPVLYVASRSCLPCFPSELANQPLQLLGFMIVGTMLLFTVQALGELAVLYPVNGAFFQYAVRFIDPAWYDFSTLLFSKFILTFNQIGVSQWVGITP